VKGHSEKKKDYKPSKMHNGQATVFPAQCLCQPSLMPGHYALTVLTDTHEVQIDKSAKYGIRSILPRPTSHKWEKKTPNKQGSILNSGLAL